MLFDSIEFAIFFAVVMALYVVLRRPGQNIMLLFASYFFYGYWDWRFLSLLMISTVVDYYCSVSIDRTEDPRRRKLLLTVSMVGNLTFLGFFKYFNFFIENFHVMMNSLGLDLHGPVLHIVLPVGISFYTFQSMSYVVDVYRRDLKPPEKLTDFALFVAFFPQLVAGPIERATHLIPEILRDRKMSWEKISDGCWLIYWGLFKKMFIADNVGRYVDAVYNAPHEASALAVILATIGFAVQIYSDFSGYTDVARGTAKIMGFELCLNFNLPYFAKDPADFWRRWHISLSQWLRDYLYIPLGGNRGTTAFIYRNLMLTMVLGGLWHGARWNFILWGVFHGLLLIGYRIAGRKDGETSSRVKTAISIVIMFFWTCVGWMLFRIENMENLKLMLKGFSTWAFNDHAWWLFAGVFGFSAPLIVMQIFQFWKNDLMVIRQAPAWLRTLVYIGMYFGITLGGVFDDKPFIYFQF